MISHKHHCPWRKQTISEHVCSVSVTSSPWKKIYNSKAVLFAYSVMWLHRHLWHVVIFCILSIKNQLGFLIIISSFNISKWLKIMEKDRSHFFRLQKTVLYLWMKLGVARQLPVFQSIFFCVFFFSICFIFYNGFHGDIFTFFIILIDNYYSGRELA